MKGKRIALLLAAILTANSVTSTVQLVSGAEFSAGDMEEQTVFSSEQDDVFTEPKEIEEQEEVTGAEESELFSDSAAEDGSVIPDDVQELTLDEDYAVLLTKIGDEVWFSFTPDEDGMYGFSSGKVVNVCTNIFPEVIFYDKKVNDKDEYTDRDKDGKCDGCSNFQLNAKMKAGNTYYYCVRLASIYGENQTSFPVRINRIPDFQSLTVLDMPETIIAGSDTGYAATGTYEITYADGSTAKIYQRFPYFYDLYDNYFYYIFKKNGEDYTKDTFEEGNYTVQIKGSNYRTGMEYISEEYSFTAIPMEQSERYKGKAADGETTVKPAEDAIMSFVPEESGKYQIILDNSKVDKVKIKSGDIYSEVEGKSNIYELEAGQKYYIFLGYVGSSEKTLKIVRQTAVKDVLLDYSGVEKTTFLEALDTCKLVNGKIIVTYNDEETVSLDLKYYEPVRDSKGNSFFYYLKKTKLEDNQKYDTRTQKLDAGTYQVVITCNDLEEYETSCRIQVNPIENLRELKEGENEDVKRTLTSDFYTWYQFIPNETKNYCFFNAGTVEIVNGKNMRWLYPERYQDCYENSFCELDKGEVYYIGLDGGGNYDSTLKIGTYDVKSIRLVPEKEKEHVLGMPMQPGAWSTIESLGELEVVYSDDTTIGKIIEPPFSSGGKWMTGIRNFEVKMVNAETGETVEDYYDITAGTYKLSCTDGTITSNEVTLHAVTAKNFPSLEIGKKQLFEVDQYYIIEPEKTAEYIFEYREILNGKERLTDLYGDGTYSIYEIDEETGRRYLTIIDKENEGRILYAGKKYLISINFTACRDGSDTTVCIKPYDQVKSVEVLSCFPADLEYTIGLDPIKLDSIKVRISYASGSVRETEITDISSGIRKEELLFEIGYRDKNGKFYKCKNGYNFNSKSDYVMRVGFGSLPVYAEDIKVHFVDPTEMKDTNIKLSAAAGKWTTVKYTPSFTGTYRISAAGGTVDPCVYYRDIEVSSSRLVLTTIENGKCELTRNQTCYFRVYSDQENPEFTVINNKCQWIEQSRKEPTCTEAGKIVNICKLHGEQNIQTIEPLGHEMGEWIISRRVTCTENGEKIQKCMRCNMENTEIIEATGHDWGEWKTIQEATCIANGIKRKTCSVCKNAESQITEASGHEWGEEQTMEAGEDTSGKVYKICSRCNEEEILQILPALKILQTVQNVNDSLENIDEELTEDQKKVVDDAVKQITDLDNAELLHSESAMDTIAKVEDLLIRSEKQIGETHVVTADSLGNVETIGAALTAAQEAEDISETSKLAAKLSVTESENSYEHMGEDALAVNITLSLINTETNETIEGKKDIQPKAPIQITMEIPDNLKGRNLTLVHMKDDGVQENVKYQVDDSNSRISFAVASLSDYVFVPGICIGEHTMEEENWTEVVNATCVSEGRMNNKCIVCGFEQEKIIPLCEHDFSVKTDEGKNATCTEDGYEVYKCLNCEETINKILFSAGHNFVKASKKNATCIVEGEILYQCQNSGCEAYRTETIPKTAHTWKEKITQKSTCGKTGKKILICTKCSTKVSAVIPYGNNHKFAWKEVKPTYQKTGKKYQKCTICGLIVNESLIDKETPVLNLNIPQKETLPLREKQTFCVKATKIANGDKVVSWKSSNTKIVSVSSNGEVKGKRTGTAMITVKLKSGLISKFKVKVQKAEVAATSITVRNKVTNKKIMGTVSLKIKKTLKLSVSLMPVTCKQKITYTSSNKKVASVTSRGVITAKKKGTAVITVKAGKKNMKIKIRVK